MFLNQWKEAGNKMANLDLTQYGITGTTEIVHNPSYQVLFEEETKSDLTGYDKGYLTELDAIDVMTGVYTGRSPKDKFIVKDENSKDTVWWTSEEYKNDNHPASQEAWEAVKEIAKELLRLYAKRQNEEGYAFSEDTVWQEVVCGRCFLRSQ